MIIRVVHQGYLQDQRKKRIQEQLEACRRQSKQKTSIDDWLDPL